MRYVLIPFFLIVGLPALAWADLFVCFDEARPLGQQFYAHPSIDPTKLPPADAPYCTAVSKANTGSQRAFLQQQRAQGLWKHLKTAPDPDDGRYALAVEMSQAEKDDVDAYLAGQATTQQAFQQELAKTNICKFADLTAVNTRMSTDRAAMQTDIDALSVSAADKTELGQLVDKIILLVQENMRCDVSERTR